MVDFSFIDRRNSLKNILNLQTFIDHIEAEKDSTFNIPIKQQSLFLL